MGVRVEFASTSTVVPRPGPASNTEQIQARGNVLFFARPLTHSASLFDLFSATTLVFMSPTMCVMIVLSHSIPLIGNLDFHRNEATRLLFHNHCSPSPMSSKREFAIHTSKYNEIRIRSLIVFALGPGFAVRFVSIEAVIIVFWRRMI